MSINLYIIRHGRINTNESNESEYLHLSEAGMSFARHLEKHFSSTYFDQILYHDIDTRSGDSYNKCQSTIQGLKGVKSEINNAQLSMTFNTLNSEANGLQNVLCCFKAEGFLVLSNIISPGSDEEFSKEYHRVFHYRFSQNHYRFIDKFTAVE